MSNNQVNRNLFREATQRVTEKRMKKLLKNLNDSLEDMEKNMEHNPQNARFISMHEEILNLRNKVWLEYNVMTHLYHQENVDANSMDEGFVK